ncbi:MAG: hypothetical protein HQK64_03795 [Desulfamplus sp.]|nr:hypothetical protein [Desulfamplus sp.]
MKNKSINSDLLIEQCGSTIKKYLENTDGLIIVIIDENLLIQGYNTPFLRMVTSRCFFKRVKNGEIKGQSILSFLMAESHAVFKNKDQNSNQPEDTPEDQSKVQPEVTDSYGDADRQDDSFIKTKLNFSINNSPSMTMNCYIFKTDTSTIIIGEHIILTDSHFMDKMSILNNEMANMLREIQHKNREIEQKNFEIEEKNRALEKAYSEIKTLSGIIPICMHCKQIRDDQGYWNRVEEYITKHSAAQFSHGICPDCMKKHYSEYL